MVYSSRYVHSHMVRPTSPQKDFPCLLHKPGDKEVQVEASSHLERLWHPNLLSEPGNTVKTGLEDVARHVVLTGVGYGGWNCGTGTYALRSRSVVGSS